MWRQGRPLSAALAFVVGSWFVCLPLAYVFGFTLNYNLYGVWYALVAGYGKPMAFYPFSPHFLLLLLGTVTIMAFVGVFRGNWTDAMVIIDCQLLRANPFFLPERGC
jgi:uncharacterized membrane protein